MSSEEDWSCDANDAVHITLVQPDQEKPKTLSGFHPQFTYPIFGDEERIFGYKGLIIRLRFAAHDLRPHVHISYDDKFKAIGDTAPLDLLDTIKPWLPEEAFTSLPEYEKAVQEDQSAKDFTPPGKRVHSYVTRGRSFEIWAGSLADPEVRRLLNRAQVFVSFFIEAGTPLETDDPEWTLERWTVYFIYEKTAPPTPTASPYSLVGYATTYRWWLYQRDSSQKPTVQTNSFPMTQIRPTDLPARLRVAQFLILPPHQGFGHGTHLYTIIHSACVADKTIVELTVEDPNEAFDGLRDTADYHILHPEFTKHKININPDPYEAHSKNQRPRLVPTAALIPTKLLHDIRMSYKIAPTQFAHILEMFLLSQIPLKNRLAGGANMSRLLIRKYKTDDPDERRYYWWRLLLKQRLYKRSRDVLIQLDMSERVQKLDETVSFVEEGYESLLQGFAAREEGLRVREEEAAKLAESGSASESTAVLDEASDKPGGTLGIRDKRAKRKFTVEEEDEEEDDEEGSGSEASKRPKV